MMDWAEWTIQQNGYAKEAVLGRLVAGELGFGNGFGSMIPIGVLVPPRLEMIQRAINGLQYTTAGKAVTAHKVYWTVGGAELGYDAVRKMYKCGQNKAYHLVQAGAYAMRGYIHAVQDAKYVNA